eukprot:m.122740 g.122740  ORF g.122740 m.122740 type:complete len:581 (+) comp37797_c0_seq11:1208-2950(+)
MAARSVRPEIVVAFDIGTTYSGYAWSFATGKYQIHAMREANPAIGQISSSNPPGKVPTVLLLHPDGKFHSFGHKAISNFGLIDEQAEWLYFKRFKMELHNLSRNTMATAANGKKRSLKLVFSLTLHHFSEEAIKQMESHSATDVNPDDVTWVITVPAIWNDAAKQIMREAAYEAGLTSRDQPDRLVIALEPEAAALYCKSVSLMSGVSEVEDTTEAYKSGTKYLLADCGGGTVDVAVHEVGADGTMRELHHATGGAWGGTYVDNNFVSLLERMFGKESIERFQKDHQGEWVNLISQKFEAAKRCAEIDKSIHVEFPLNFYLFMQEQNSSVEDCIKSLSNSDLKFFRGCLRINYAEVAKLFESVFANIVTHLKDVIEKIDGIEYVILVGGFATCPLLQIHLKEQLESSYCVRVVVARESSLAVVMGSVLFGHDPKALTARRAKYTYGVASHKVFEQGDDNSRRITDDYGRTLCRDAFIIFVKKNQEIKVNEEIQCTFEPTKKDCAESFFQIGLSEDENPHYFDSDRMKKTALLTVRTGSQSKKKPAFTVFMKFGATEVKIRAVNMSTEKNDEIHFDLDFLH